MPTIVDATFLAALFVFVAIVETFVFVPRFRARVAAGDPNARLHAYRRTTIGQWVVTIAVLAGWTVAGRSWRALGIVPVGGWQLWVAAALVVAFVAFAVAQASGIRRVAASAEARDKHRGRFAKVAFLLPATPDEFRWFMVLSATAGICEEILCRGYLVWFLAAYVGTPAAFVLNAFAFGAAHAYQGWRGVLQTTAVGLVMSGIVALSGWLLPAVLLHALIDATSGMLAYAVLRDGQREVLEATA